MFLRTGFKIYPNPTVDKSIKISYHVDRVTKVEINLYNLLGKVARRCFQTCKHQAIISSATILITGGIYILELMVDNKRSVQKLVVQ
jgi:hypothetical protein